MLHSITLSHLFVCPGTITLIPAFLHDVQEYRKLSGTDDVSLLLKVLLKPLQIIGTFKDQQGLSPC